ncbi:MAG: TIGR03936 family radical SAM-associated protein [Clostridia bacterium]|nr:TIGR03936 family radical SAM-associated protein [Clostridia bacterium]
MKNVRLFYKKGDRMRFISHLDMTRFMARIIRRADLPVWYTEGFNPHLYMTFALPLSLGMSSEYDVVDIRLLDDGYDISTLCGSLNAVCPPYIKFFDAKDPVKKAGDVCFAEFKIIFDDMGEAKAELESFLSSNNITVLKKTKKGIIKEIEVSDKIINFSFDTSDTNTVLNITLPAGSVENLNPELILTAFFEQNGSYYCYDITRTAIFDKDKKLFK